jgi:hypothetical protein
MAGITFMTTADEQTTGRWSVVSGATVSSDYARTGTYAFKLTSGATLQRAVASSATLSYVRVGVLLAGTATFFRIRYFESATLHVVVQLDLAAGTVSVLRNGTELGSYSASLVADTWYCVEAFGTIHDSTGTVGVKLNGVTVLALTAQDTRNGGVGVCDNVQMYSAGGTSYVDDVMFRDDTWPGSGGIYLTTINAEATSGVKEFTASASTPDTCVDEMPASFTDYIYRDNDLEGDAHEFEHTGIPNLNYDSISGMAIIALAKLASAGSGALKTRFYDPANAAGAAGAAVALDTSGVYVEAYPTVDGGSNPLTRTAVNQMYIGVEVGAVP